MYNSYNNHDKNSDIINTCSQNSKANIILSPPLRAGYIFYIWTFAVLHWGEFGQNPFNAAHLIVTDSQITADKSLIAAVIIPPSTALLTIECLIGSNESCTTVLNWRAPVEEKKTYMYIAESSKLRQPRYIFVSAY